MSYMDIPEGHPWILTADCWQFVGTTVAVTVAACILAWAWVKCNQIADDFDKFRMRIKNNN